MVISECIKCDTCDTLYRLRVGVGVDKFQKHYMDCFECSTPIVFAVRAVPPSASIQIEENCTLVEFDLNHLVVNFHPACAFNKDRIHDSMYFPSMELIKMIDPYMRKPENARMLSASHLFDIPNAPTKWGQLKLISKHIAEGNNKKAQATAKLYMSARNTEINIYRDDELYSHVALQYEFLDWLFYPRIHDIARPIIDKITELKKDGLLDAFYDHYKNEFKVENKQKYINIYSDFMSRRDHFGQLIYHARINNDDIEGKIISSKNFDQIRSFYGDAYETLTSNMNVLACLNNIICGRKFDEFLSMSLGKYINDVSKDKKTGPFKDNHLFSAFCEDDLESTIRNGSHHASIWHEGETIRYRSGGTGAQREISYTKYIHLCNKLTLKIVSLWIIELHIQYLYEKEDEDHPWFSL